MDVWARGWRGLQNLLGRQPGGSGCGLGPRRWLGDVHHGGRGLSAGRRAQTRPQAPVHVAKRCPAQLAPPRGAPPDPWLGEGPALVPSQIIVRGLFVSPDRLSGWEHLGTAVVQFCVSTRLARASLQLSFARSSGVTWWVGPAGEGGTLSGSVPGTMGMGAGYGPEGCSQVLGQDGWVLLTPR